MRLYRTFSESQLTISSNSPVAVPDADGVWLTKTLVLPRFAASSALTPPVVFALGPSEKITAGADAVRAGAAPQVVAVTPVLLAHTLRSGLSAVSVVVRIPFGAVKALVCAAVTA